MGPDPINGGPGHGLQESGGSYPPGGPGPRRKSERDQGKGYGPRK